jgi:PAS domain S-box-containing protein
MAFVLGASAAVAVGLGFTYATAPAELKNMGFLWRTLLPAILGTVLAVLLLALVVSRLQHSIRRSESSASCFERILNLTFDAIVATDRGGRILLANARAERLFGRDRTELINQPLGLVIPGEDWRRHLKESWETLSTLDARVRTGGADLIGRHRDGHALTLEVHIARVDLHGEPLLVSVFRDASERKKAEASLNEQEARLRLLMTEMPAIIWTTDDKLQITSTVGKGLADLNLRPNEVIGMSLAEHLKKSDMDCTPIAAHLRALHGESLSYDMEWMGRHFQVRVDPLRNPARLVIGTIGVVIDVTARRQAELALERKQEEITEFFQAAAIGLHWVSPEGRILWGNNAILHLLGYACEEYVGLHFQDVNVDGAATAGLLQRMLREEELHNQELRLRAKDGSVKHVLLDTLPYRELGKLMHTRCFLRDISEAKSLEEQLRKSQKMEAVGRLAGGIAHDFNNLLTIISGYGNLLTGMLDAAHPGRELAEEINKAGERAARLIRQLLIFSRHQVIQPRVVDLNVLIRDMQPLLRGGLGEDITLSTDLDPALGTVRTDPTQMEQVLMNLAVNARDAMPSGGQLLIRTRNATLDQEFVRQRPELRPGPHVQLDVIDTGHGMDEATLARIFEPFFTTKEQGKGTGLGLATVYGIITQSRGWIHAHSALGSGARFSIYLPQSTQQLPCNEQTLSSGHMGGQETILLVEDEESLRALASHILRQNGYHVLTAEHGVEAMAVANRHQGRIDLLATDVVMPNMDGRKLAQRLVCQRPDLNVLFLSGYTEDEVIGKGYADKSMAFLPKPFTPDTLARKVREVLDAVG